jgi:hypothetical protein
MRAKNDNIGHTAHFGGAIGGYVITLISNPHLVVDHTFMVILLTIPIIILCDGKMGNYSGITLEYCYFINLKQIKMKKEYYYYCPYYL